MLVGQTGAGKSYLANAFLGSRNPSKGKFTTGDDETGDDELTSVTKMVNGWSGSFFGTKEDRDFPDEIDHFKLNVVDSPGWGDTDPKLREKNSQKIGQSLSFGVNLFILVQKGKLDRFPSSTEEKILGDLHKWTNGAIWSRLLIVDRVSYGDKTITDRSENKNKGVWFESQNIEPLKRMILKSSKDNEWSIVDGDIKRNLTMEDLEGLRRLPFDASQTDKCEKTYIFTLMKV